MDKLYFGTAGIPLSAKGKDPVAGIKRVRELGLGCMELEFVYGVRMSPQTAVGVRQAAEETGVMLSAHGPYYINLSSQEVPKRESSRERILTTARIGHLCGARSITFHAAFFQKQDPESVYGTVKEELKDIVAILRKEGNFIWVRPELTGKSSQFGSLEEIIRLSGELEGVMPCVDFSHLHARTGGDYNNYKEFCSILEAVKNGLGGQAMDDMHIHVSGIEYTPKGERKHLNISDSDFNYPELLQALKEYDARGLLICESPNLEEDALLLQEEYIKL
ncbi:TIM barrel protein [candidate division KSB1 bacterium]|nr:TIM barrel protein [candidate division KSB1 bacterium]